MGRVIYEKEQVDEPEAFRPAIHYAGFWRRFVAIIIDYQVVAICLFPLFVLLGFVAPNQVVVYVPFGLFSPEAVVESTSEKVEHDNGSVTVEATRITKQEVLGRWTYFYEQISVRSGKQSELGDRVLIDPDTGNHLDWMELDDYIFWVLVLYWSLMESSKYQASIGKRVMGIQVTDENGQRLTFLRALGRNISKILSAFTLLIGFMMAGWTSKKQALHDMVARCYMVVK